MKQLLTFLLLLGAIFYLGSCAGPVAKVLADQQKFDQVRDEVFRRGLCLNDTVTTTLHKDSLVYRDTTITKIVRVNTPAVCRIDTLVNGQRIVLADGVITVTNTTPCRDRLRTVTKTNTVRDRARENVYLRDLENTKNESEGRRQALEVTQGTLRTRTYQSIVLLLLLAGTGFVAVKKTFLF